MHLPWNSNYSVSCLLNIIRAQKIDTFQEDATKIQVKQLQPLTKMVRPSSLMKSWGTLSGQKKPNKTLTNLATPF